MPNEFQFSVPVPGGTSQTFRISVGDVLFVLGANGAGKSSLVGKVFNQNQSDAKRISAHRQTWFESNTLNITPRQRHDVEQNIRSQDQQERSRHWEWNPEGRASIAIFDLIDADTMLERQIAALVRAGDITAATKAAGSPSPIQVINELMRLSNLPIEISLDEGQKIVAQKNGGQKYSVAELSDGERNAFLIAASILTVKPGTLVIIDEPERHLHRSIISPLLKLLFARRSDCAFVVSTHEVMLPMDMPNAATLLARGCEYAGSSVKHWTLDLLPKGTAIDESLKRDILGARRKMLFVEGAAQSLDVPLYSLLFPAISVIPKESCRDVEYAVRGLRASTDTHWASVWGIVDNDQRPPEDVERLREAGIWALSHYSVEAFYYHPKIVARIASRQASITGGDGPALADGAITSAIAAVQAQKDHLVTSTVLRAARSKVWNNLPARSDIVSGTPLRIEVDIGALRSSEEARFDSLVAAADWDGLLARYSVRESSAFGRLIASLGMTDKELYRGAVLKLLADEPSALSELRDLLGELPSQIAAA